MIKTYRRRWMALTATKLASFDKEQVYDSPTEEIELRLVTLVQAEANPSRPFSFTVQTPARNFNLQAGSDAERCEWIAAIEAAAAEQKRSTMSGPDSMSVAAVQLQKDFFNSGATRSVAWRVETIKKLCAAITQAAGRISEAQAADCVCPSNFAGAVGMLMGAMGFYTAMVGVWSAPSTLDDTLPAERRMGIDCEWLRVMEPKGVVLNIAPWNAPVLLSVLPALGAIAAGNTVVIKPPDGAPKSSALLAELIAESLPPEAVTVVQGDARVCEGLIDLGLDHIMFTGGTAIGKLVMARAAKTLTPVTLELGGKNPVLIDEMGAAFLGAAVKEIVGTKAYFAGEFCQCHDYILVVDTMWDAFVAALAAEIDALGEKRSVQLINQRHYARVKRMLTEHRGASLPAVAEPDDGALKLPVTAVLEPSSEDPIMRDEVFGPCWAVLRVASIGEAISRVNNMPTGKPLVSYYYGEVAGNAETWMEGTSSGSLAINAGPMRMQSNFNAAIHGVGNSGLGGASIWGQHVFNTFSHAKHVVKPKVGAFAGSIWGAGAHIPAAK